MSQNSGHYRALTNDGEPKHSLSTSQRFNSSPITWRYQELGWDECIYFEYATTFGTPPPSQIRFLIRPSRSIFKRSGSETLIDLGRYAPSSTHRHPHPAKPSQDGRATMHVNCCFSIFSVKSYPWGSGDSR